MQPKRKPQRYSNAPSLRGLRPNICIELTHEQFKTIDDLARARDISRSAVIRDLIDNIPHKLSTPNKCSESSPAK